MDCPSLTWDGFEEAIAADGATLYPCKIGLEYLFMGKHESFRIVLLLRFFPLRPFHDSVETFLLGRLHRLFLNRHSNL